MKGRKKIYFGGIVLLMAVAFMMFTSCLEGGTNTRTGTVTGVMRLDLATGKTVLDVPDYYAGYVAFYSPQFQNINPGACCIVNYELDFELPENSSEILAINNYYTVTVSEIQELDVFNVKTVQTDTAAMLPDEVPVLDPAYSIEGYVQNHMFVVQLINQPSDQKTNWDMSCNIMQDPIEESGQRIYDLFVRASVGTAGSKSSVDMSLINAYNVGYLLTSIAQKEKNLGNSEVYLRFNYVSSIKDGELVWGKTQPTYFLVQQIIPDGY
ncbi:MAG: hypothetical protein LBR49_07480 [Tannerella sp.]|nr:hypothetical protein [Tannerella sp.]